MIGTFGNIVFESSGQRVHTLDEFTRKSTANFAEHAIIDDKPRLQFTGRGLDEITFTIRLDVHLGVSPSDQIKVAEDIMTAGEKQTLIMGDEPVGDFVLTAKEERWTQIDGAGRLIVAYMDLTLKEFI